MDREFDLKGLAQSLEHTLRQIGIEHINVDHLKTLLKDQPKLVSFGTWVMMDDAKMKLHFAIRWHESEYRIDNYQATFVPKLPIEHRLINGIDTRHLEERIKTADWFYAYSENSVEVEKQYRKIESIESDINQLINHPEGLRSATILWNNHVPFYTATKPEEIRRYEEESDLYLKGRFKCETTIANAFEHFAGRHQLKLDETKNQQKFLTTKYFVMTEQEMTHARNQYGKLGVSDAFNEDFIAKMKNREKEIQHPYQRKYDNGDEANAVFHWKKLDNANLYFLNKWDLTVKKAGSDKEVSMTFYVNDLQRMSRVLKNDSQMVRTFTFKGSVNYLAGRPVENLYMNQKGDQYKAWDQLYPNRILPNGKMLERSFHPNYGFDLNKVVSEYRGSIKVLANTEYAERFFQSLRRGNLESTQLVEKNGKTDTYLVSPNIQIGYLDIYTKDKVKLTPEQQVEKGFISEAFGLKVRERIEQVEKANHSQKKSQGINNSKEEKQEVHKDNTSVEKVKRKQSTKQKTSGENDKPKRKLKQKM